MTHILGLGGLFFKSKDPKALALWYQEWLGMDLAHPYGINFNPENIPPHGANVWAPFKAETDYFSPSKKDFMFNLIVDDLDAMLAQIKPSGVQIMSESESGDYGDFGWFIDPEGNKVELWQPPENAPPAA